MRKLFISELLEDYMRKPKLILFSTHYINEMETLFSDMVILHEGQVFTHDDCDALRQKGTAITGDWEAVDRFVEGRELLSQRILGNQKEAVFFCQLTEQEKKMAATAAIGFRFGKLHTAFLGILYAIACFHIMNATSMLLHLPETTQLCISLLLIVVLIRLLSGAISRIPIKI